jgi:opacity protein-like surface antigen
MRVNGVRNWLAILVTVLAGVSSGPTKANATDRWSGVYAGISFGERWSATHAQSSATCPGPTLCQYNLASNLQTFGDAASGDVAARRNIWGGHMGANTRLGGLIVGLEADYQYLYSTGLTIGAKPVINSSLPGLLIGAGSLITSRSVVTMRTRIGITPFPNFLMYATGGLSLTSLDVKNVGLDNANALAPLSMLSGTSYKSSTMAGWVVGGGSEWALDRNWSIVGQLLHMNSGRLSTTSELTRPGTILPPGFVQPPNLLKTNASFSATIATVGLNYKF